MSRRSWGFRDSEISGSSNTIWFTSTSISDLYRRMHTSKLFRSEINAYTHAVLTYSAVRCSRSISFISRVPSRSSYSRMMPGG